MVHAVQQRMLSLSATTLIGDPVYDSRGEKVGDLDDLMIDLDRGCVAYAVVSFGGILGIGAEHYPVPMGALTVDTENKRLHLDMDAERIKAAPPLGDEWPSTIDHEWLGGIYDYYGTPRYW